LQPAGLACVGAGVELLKPAANDLLQRWPVSKRVNSSRADADDATLMEPLAGDETSLALDCLLSMRQRSPSRFLVRVLPREARAVPRLDPGLHPYGPACRALGASCMNWSLMTFRVQAHLRDGCVRLYTRSGPGPVWAI